MDIKVSFSLMAGKKGRALLLLVLGERLDTVGVKTTGNFSGSILFAVSSVGVF